MDTKRSETSMNEAKMISECEASEQEVQLYWTRGATCLNSAVQDLNLCLEILGSDLDHDPFFAAMPHFRDEFDYLWVLFIQWGKPETWHQEGHCLGELSQEELVCAFAQGQIDDARFLLSERCTSALSRELGEKKLRGAKRALDFIRGRMSKH